jgi:hypothetical protein
MHPNTPAHSAARQKARPDIFSIIAQASAHALLAATLCLGAGPAHAVVRGEPDETLRPHVVMVLSSKGGFCSASVLSPDVVLTAGHCVTGAKEHRIHFTNEAGEPVFIEAAAIAVHPLYSRSAVATRRRSIDLALVRLATPLPARFRPVELSGTTAPAASGEAYRVAGYGLGTEDAPRTGGQFRSAKLTVTTPYGPSRILVWLVDPSVAKGQPGSGACTGDSGGPLFGPQGDVAAVTTWAEGAGKNKCGALTQGVLVGPQRAWIDSVMADWK